MYIFFNGQKWFCFSPVRVMYEVTLTFWILFTRTQHVYVLSWFYCRYVLSLVGFHGTYTIIVSNTRMYVYLYKWICPLWDKSTYRGTPTYGSWVLTNVQCIDWVSFFCICKDYVHIVIYVCTLLPYLIYVCTCPSISDFVHFGTNPLIERHVHTVIR